MKYGVKVLFTYSVEPDKRKFYEESIYLVEADSFDDAYDKVEKYVSEFESEYKNPKGQKVKTDKVDFLDCFLVFDEEDEVQEIYSSMFNNKTSLSEEEFYNAITVQCDAEELMDLRYQEFNTPIDNDD